MAERDQRHEKGQVIPDRKLLPETDVLWNEREEQDHT